MHEYTSLLHFVPFCACTNPHRYALDRVLLAEHKAIESHKSQEALAIEKARLAAEWAPLADEHQALKKVVELRDYQVWVRRFDWLIGVVEMLCWGGRELFWVLLIVMPWH